MGQDQHNQPELTPEERQKRYERWHIEIEKAKALQELERTPPLKPVRPIEYEPTYERNEKDGTLERVA